MRVLLILLGIALVPGAARAQQAHRRVVTPPPHVAPMPLAGRPHRTPGPAATVSGRSVPSGRGFPARVETTPLVGTNTRRRP